MTTRSWVLIVLGLAVLGATAWGVTSGLERLADQTAADPAAPPSAPAATTPIAHITATLFYASSDGLALVPVRREVPFADGVEAQGRQILMAQLQPAPRSNSSVIPRGTTLRAFYVAGQGDAFVDLSREASDAHPGGARNELLTVYAIVNAVASNLPAIQRVQILIDGTQVDTLAGHVDIRRPLERDAALVRPSPAADGPRPRDGP